MKIVKKVFIPTAFVAIIALFSACFQQGSGYQFDTFTAADSIQLVSNDQSPQCQVTVSIEYPIEVPKGANLAELSDFIQFITLDTTSMTSIEEAYSTYLAGVTSNYEALRPAYISSNKPGDKAPFASFSWQMSIQGKVSYPNDSMLGYEVRFYSFTGGAHGMEVVKHYLFERNTGTQLRYEELFREDAHNELTALISEQATHQYEQEQFFDTFFINGRLTIEPSRDIRFTPTGVDFIYQRYDVAPYSTGLIVISVPMKLITPLLKEEIAKKLNVN